MIVNLCIVTRNKSIHVTTLHSAMNMNMFCMSKGIHVDTIFVNDRSGINKYMKNCDRLVWIDYGVSIDIETVKKFLEEFPDNCKVLIGPCVTEGIDWEMFKKKTLEGSQEPVEQRGLRFDTVINPTKNKDIGEFVSSTTDGRVFAMDTKSVLKKLRDSDSQYKSMEHLKKIGVKIGVLRSTSVLCHYVHESIGNILESSGVRAGP